MLKSLTIIVVLLVLLNCNSSEKQSSKTETIELKTLQSEMQVKSDNLISTLMGNLKTEMMSAVKEGGFENAIQTCQLKAPVITDSLQTEEWSINRVTDKPRNKNNTISEEEKEILAMFADSLNNIEFYDKWESTDEKSTYFYYKPIYMGKLCLKCHGTIETLDSKAIVAIKTSYPDDKAVGYNDGDLRGMFVVQAIK